MIQVDTVPLELYAADAEMRMECMAAAAAKAVRARNHVIHLERYIEGRDWFTRHVGGVPLDCGFGPDRVPTNFGDRVSPVEAAFRVQTLYPDAEVRVEMAVVEGVDITLFPRSAS